MNTPILSLDYFKHEDELNVIIGCEDNNAYMFSITDKETLHDRVNILKIFQSNSPVNSIKIIPLRKLILLGSQDGSVSLFNYEGLLMRRYNQMYSDPITSIDIDVNGWYFATGHQDGKVKLWTINNNSLISIFSAHSGGVNSVCMSKNGNNFWLLTGGNDYLVKLWD